MVVYTSFVHTKITNEQGFGLFLHIAKLFARARCSGTPHMTTINNLRDTDSGASFGLNFDEVPSSNFRSYYDDTQKFPQE